MLASESIVTILLVILIILLLISLVLFLTTRYLKRVAKRKEAERYAQKGSLLPIANINYRPRTKLPQHPSMSFDDSSFRKSIYQCMTRSPSPANHEFRVPEIRITFPDEDSPPSTPGWPGQRMSRVVVVQVGESGAAYVTPPPPYEGFHDVDMEVGGIRQKA
jgi:hypothetical protein